LFIHRNLRIHYVTFWQLKMILLNCLSSSMNYRKESRIALKCWIASTHEYAAMRRRNKHNDQQYSHLREWYTLEKNSKIAEAHKYKDLYCNEFSLHITIKNIPDELLYTLSQARLCPIDSVYILATNASKSSLRKLFEVVKVCEIKHLELEIGGHSLSDFQNAFNNWSSKVTSTMTIHFGSFDISKDIPCIIELCSQVKELYLMQCKISGRGKITAPVLIGSEIESIYLKSWNFDRGPPFEKLIDKKTMPKSLKEIMFSQINEEDEWIHLK